MSALRPCILLLVVCSSLFAWAQDGQAAKDSVYTPGPITVLPEFPGGEQAMYTWLSDNTHYPKEALKKRIQGKVYVEFVVEKDGHVDQVTLRRGCDPLLDEEALRIVGQMPVWKPASLNGAIAAIRLTIPIVFKL